MCISAEALLRLLVAALTYNGERHQFPSCISLGRPRARNAGIE